LDTNIGRQMLRSADGRSVSILFRTYSLLVIRPRQLDRSELEFSAPLTSCCQLNRWRQRIPSSREADQAAAVAAVHVSNARARKRRSVGRRIRWGWRLKTLQTAAWVARNFCADALDLNFCCFRSRRRIGRSEFSARLFSRIPPGRWRSVSPRSRVAARSEASLSVTIASGRTPWFFNNFRSSFRAALCCAAPGPPCRGLRLHHRRPARGTTACRRSSRPSRRDASGP